MKNTRSKQIKRNLMSKLPGKVFTVSHQVSSNATFLKENLDLFARTEEAFSFKQCCQNDIKNQSFLHSRSMCHSQNTAILNLFQVLLNMSNWDVPQMSLSLLKGRGAGTYICIKKDSPPLQNKVGEWYRFSIATVQYIIIN